MRRFLLFVLAIAGSLALSSCFEIEERLKLNADGSGSRTVTVDMGELLASPFLAAAMSEELGGEEETKKDSSWTKLAELGPLNPDWTEEERDLVGRHSGQMTMDMDEGVFLITETFEFDEIGQISQFQTLIAQANKPVEEEGEDDGGMMGDLGSGDGDMFNHVYTFASGKFSQVSRNDEPEADAEMDENMEMIKSMMGDASYDYIIEFPGKIKKVNGFPGHEIDGAMLIQEIPLVDLMGGELDKATKMTGSVKFKK